MAKQTKIWLMVAGALVVLGAVLFAGVMTTLKWDFSKLSTHKYKTSSYEITESFGGIIVEAKEADVVLLPASDAKCTVICYEQEKITHAVTVKDGALVIAVEDTRAWYDYIGIRLGRPKITVYLPAGAYGALQIKCNTGDVEVAGEFFFESAEITTSTGDVTQYASVENGVKIKTSTGDIRLEHLSMGALDLTVSTGKITAAGVTATGEAKISVSTGKTTLSDVKCGSLASWGGTGDITLQRVIVAERCSIERSTGKVCFEASDAAEIFVKTDTGDVTGSLLTEKVFLVDTDTGHRDVPHTVSGGKCEITTDTGNVHITIGH